MTNRTAPRNRPPLAPRPVSAIAMLRLRLGLTQAQFAAHVGVSTSTVRRWEREGTAPAVRAVRDRLAELEGTE